MKSEVYIKDIIDEEKIYDILRKTKNPSPKIISIILDKAKEKKGLELEEVGFLVNLNEPELEKELFRISSKIKDEIYGERLVFFAPLYVSNFCINDCEYCNFHMRNKEMNRKKLTLDEIEEQVKFLINSGHKRLLLEFGEDPINNSIDYIVEVIEKIYSIYENGNIRRVNVNIAATTTSNYRKLKNANIGAYQLFQETYHRSTYKSVHNGQKSDFERQLFAHNRALDAGIDDRGFGVLFGLYDWKFEVLGLISHSIYLDKRDKVGPHTISVPRFCPAPTVTYNPHYKVSDNDFLKIIAILRLAVPYTGLVISTREKPEIRRIAFKIGISQSSAGSVTSTGGYGKNNTDEVQFELHDTRSLYQTVEDILNDNLLPSFCTACYRSKRTGEKFMDLVKAGDIHNFCRPNGLLTFAEYLEDFSNDGLYKKGYRVINHYLNQIDNETIKKQTISRLEKIKQGERDIYF